VPSELGDRQRLRMLTAKVGSPKDLFKLNRLGCNGKAPETFARLASSPAGG
jgi:hypothetical protein